MKNIIGLRRPHFFEEIHDEIEWGGGTPYSLMITGNANALSLAFRFLYSVGQMIILGVRFFFPRPERIDLLES